MKIAIIGYGKMGKAVEDAALQKNIIIGEERNKIEVIFDVKNKEKVTPEALSKADVAIEFTTPTAAVENLLMCFEANIPVVSGTTGWQDNVAMIKKICIAKKQAMVLSSNFSIGMNFFFEINKRLARMMNSHHQYDVNIKEIHHTEKLDKPSGTAISLANDILHELDRKEKWVNEQSNQAKDLVILSQREEDVPGIHNINYISDVDSIVIRHTANSRKGFAEGALLASEWIIGKTGFFDMNDVLNLKKLK